jgi:hypothetical protein
MALLRHDTQVMSSDDVMAAVAPPVAPTAAAAAPTASAAPAAAAVGAFAASAASTEGDGPLATIERMRQNLVDAMMRGEKSAIQLLDPTKKSIHAVEIDGECRCSLGASPLTIATMLVIRIANVIQIGR